MTNARRVKRCIIIIIIIIVRVGLPRSKLVLRYDTRCYFNVRSKADISQLNLTHGTDN